MRTPVLVTVGRGDEALRTNHPLGSGNGHGTGVTVVVFLPTGNPTPTDDAVETARDRAARRVDRFRRDVTIFTLSPVTERAFVRKRVRP